MYRGKRIWVVVPAYNESGHVGSVIATMPSFVDCVLIVDDASTDNTSGTAMLEVGQPDLVRGEFRSMLVENFV